MELRFWRDGFGATIVHLILKVQAKSVESYPVIALLSIKQGVSLIAFFTEKVMKPPKNLNLRFPWSI